MKIDIHNNVGKVVGNIKIDKKLLVSDSHSSVVRQAVLSELVNLRQGTHSSKNRSAVRGGGRSLGSKRVEALLGLEQLGHLYGKVAEQFLVQNHIVTIINFLKKWADSPEN